MMHFDTFTLVLILTALSFIAGVSTHILVAHRRSVRGQMQQEQHIFGDAEEPKSLRNAIILILLLVAFASALLYSYAKVNHWDDLLVELFAALFALSGAGFIGQIVFESLLREQLLARTSRILTRIILTEKEILSNLFSQPKLDEIVEKILQIRAGDDAFGRALAHWLIPYLLGGSSRPVRRDFSDEICFRELQNPTQDQQLLGDYYIVTDRLEFRTRLPAPEIKMGCAVNQEGLYGLFNDATCIYRWAVFEDEQQFDALAGTNRLFAARLFIQGEECPQDKAERTTRGWEIIFRNPLPAIMPQSKQGNTLPSWRAGDVGWSGEVLVEIQVATLHPRKEHFLSVHLAYPVDEARIAFDFGGTQIRKVDTIHFFTAQEPQIRKIEGANGTDIEEITVTAKSARWIFPDAGVVFVWD